MRGQRSLFQIIGNEAAEAKPNTQRPRNVLMPNRNSLLFYRFYCLAEIYRMRYDDILAQLEDEFFIVSVRIVVVLTHNDSELRQIVAAKPDIKQLEKQFPHINWRYRPEIKSK